jgi:cellulose synthase/poly-beta-1,6-N-acetylglucosamine synthase-like glycosyltransferase
MTDLEIPLGKRTRFYRFFEMLPGAVSYTIIALPILLSFINPLYGAIFVIVFIIIWFVKTVGMSYRTIQGYNTLQRAQRIDWKSRLSDLEDPVKALQGRHYSSSWRAEVHQHNLEQLEATVNARKPSDIYNAVIIATYNESRDVLEPTIQAVLDGDYDPKRIIMTIAYEARGPQETEDTVKELQKKYASRFSEFYIVKHPADMPDEVVGKGGNITFAGKFLAGELEKLSIDPENVLVTTLDSDNRPHRTYFAYVTYEFIVHPEPRHAAFQPLALFQNNIWDVPAPMRVIATGNSFWSLLNSLRPHMLRNFAAHSQSMAALIDMDFWSVRTIVEDGHQFWRSYFRFDGHYQVVPIYVPIYQDAVLADGYRKTLKAQFVQLRRWAYGASDVAYVASRVFTKNRTVPLGDGISKFFRLLEGHVSWASASLILLFGAWGPLFINPESNRSLVAHELPTIASGLQRFAMIGLFIVVFLAFRMLPPRPERYRRHRSVWMLLQWVLMPVTSIVYGSAAALNSQTRLLFGKYLDKFDVTDKAVVQSDGKAKS